MPYQTPNSSNAMYKQQAEFVKRKKQMQRRTRVPDRPNKPLNLWGILKNCIGKDLSRIPLPVNFSEPLSLLQRIAEDYVYSALLDQAALCQDSTEQLAYLAAFSVSCYAPTVYRTTKPFNPLLGETFEWDRSDDFGWRLISEQVSHHPPIAAQHCESREWTRWQEYAVTAKFRGKYVLIKQLGISHIIFHKSGNHYTWKKVLTTVHNIIIGKLWLDHSGQMIITNHTDSSVCNINFLPYSAFRLNEQRKISGEVMNSNGEVKWLINGKWDTEVIISPVFEVTGKPDNPEYNLGPSISIWRIEELPQESENYYNFSLFTCQLNEMEEDIAPTDSRYRPDQRLMEEGKWDEANTMKAVLEEKQRVASKHYVECNNVLDEHSLTDVSRISTECSAVSIYEPMWFKKELDPITGELTHVYNGNYWEAKRKQDWSECPNIFL